MGSYNDIPKNTLFITQNHSGVFLAIVVQEHWDSRMHGARTPCVSDKYREVLHIPADMISRYVEGGIPFFQTDPEFASLCYGALVDRRR